MSSEEEDGQIRYKKRRLQNACDSCRKRKVKCDSATMPGNICTNCISFNSQCTHKSPSKKRGPKTDLYVEQLEHRVTKLEEALMTYVPGIDLEAVVSSTSSFNKPASDPPMTGNPRSASSSLSPAGSPALLESNPSQDESVMNAEFGKLRIATGLKGRFFGPSSSYKYFTDAVKIKRGYMNEEHPGFTNVQGLKRSECWDSPSYEVAAAKGRGIETFDFPPGDLLQDLIDIHFRTSHCTMPVVHEPKFRKNVQERLHHYDLQFGKLVMMMCALASRDSDDPRVLLPGEKESSAGWKYYEQVEIVRKSMFEPPELHELQMYCLAMKYAVGTSAPQGSWIFLSLGLRFCHELGIHRRRPPGFPVTIEEEERKRVFWYLVGLDRCLSSFVGRPSGYRDEDFDADLPAECDDEYMIENADGTICFAQPADKPSKMLFMTCIGRLQDILSVALRALYSTTKSRTQMGLTGEGWQQDVVSELDSALNRWVDSVPPHLRWNPGHLDRTFFSQSSLIFIVYNTVQIQIHRPLVASANKNDSTSASIICANAARSIAGIVGAQLDRKDVAFDPVCSIGCFMSAVTLLMHMWSNRQRGIVSYLQRDAADIEKCKMYLQMTRKRWLSAGRFSDLIDELSFAKDIPIPQTVRTATKRERSEERPAQASTPAFNNIITSDTPTNMWAANYIPQYSGREDFPSIPMQIPVSTTGTFDYTTSTGHVLGEPLQAIEDQMFWQAPMGFDMVEWGQYIFRMTDELNRNDASAVMGGL